MTATDLQVLLDRFGLSTSDVDARYRELRAMMTAEVAEVVRERADGSAIPTIEFAAVASGDVHPDDLAAIRRRGCVVIRSNFDRELALEWDREVGDYLATNRFEERFAARYPEAAASGSRIWAVYWSKAQVAARQHPDMAVTRRFLNRFWSHESDGSTWFDPLADIGYPDRLRRRAPGIEANGLPPHCDSASSGGWRIAENADVFRHVLGGALDRFDPWDGAHRTGAEADPAAPSSVFRTFQGWTALSEMHPVDGGLNVVPIPAAAAYLLVQGIAAELGLLAADDDDDDDEDDDDDGGDGRKASTLFRADDVLLPALTPMPVIEPGDTVWWHGDLLHSVDPAANDRRWSNVMYIAATPRCPRNDAYATSMLERFVSGRSPLDFPDDDFEIDFRGRATIDDLNSIGRGFLGLPTAGAAAR